MKGEKVTKRGELNEFPACHLAPAPGHSVCVKLLQDSSLESLDDRLDVGMMTRGRKEALGLEDILTTEEGCRKRDTITKKEKEERMRILS